MVRNIVIYVIEAYVAVLFVYIVLSWFPGTGGDSGVGRVRSALGLVTEPLLSPLRRLLPPVRAGGAALDLSPIIVFVVLQFVVIPVIRAA
ncbi:MAG: YggT family protein [Acidimicrobiales bacterium]